MVCYRISCKGCFAMQYSKLLLFVSGVMCASIIGQAPAHSVSMFIDRGIETVDPSTNLAWLDMTLTEGLSVDAAMSAFPNYRVPTADSVYQMFLNGGITAIDNTFRSSDAAAGQRLVNLFGETFRHSNTHGFQGFAGENGSFIEPFIGVLDDLSAAKVYPGLCLCFPGDHAIADVSVFMVRDVAPIPLPASAFLLIFGLSALSIGKARARWLKSLSGKSCRHASRV
jgi:hypothetical protein